MESAKAQSWGDILQSRIGTATHQWTIASWLTCAAVVVTVLALLPLTFIGWMAFETGWSAAAALVFRPRVGELLVNTALLAALALPACAVLAVALAWLTERTDLPGRSLFAWLAVAPLAIPAFVHSYAWVSLFPALGGAAAAAFVAVLAYFPFMYLPIAAAMRRLDPGLEDTAASLGLPPMRVFVRVVLPQLRLALCGGGLLIGLHLLAEYGLFVMIRFDTFTTAIVDQFQSAYNGPAAVMLAGVLVLCCIGALAFEAWLRGARRYARIGNGISRPQPRVALGRLRLPLVAMVLAINAISIGVPLVTLARWLAKGGSGVWPAREIVPSILQTLSLGLIGATVATIAALPMAWLSVRLPDRRRRLLEACNYFVGAIPAVIVALALVSISIRLARPLYQTLATLLIAYTIMFLPRALVSLRASIAQVPNGLEEAATSLGRSPARAICEITLRLAAPGIASSMALVSLGITTELTATLMLAPNGTRTLATQFWAYTSELDYAAAAPYALLMVLSSLPMTILLHRQARWAAAQ